MFTDEELMRCLPTHNLVERVRDSDVSKLYVNFAQFSVDRLDSNG